jgi:uncharacterized protein YqgC (DUF456 family)
MELLAGIGAWTGYALWALLLVTLSLFVYLGLGGTFLVLAAALIHALVTGFDPIGWRLLLVLLGLALVGEGIEFVIGTFYAARKGATRWGVVGAFLGGLLGAAAGNGVVPVIGAVVGSLLGAFGGAVAGEYLRNERLEPSLRIGGHAFVGRVAAMAVKHVMALIMVGLILRATAP